MPELPEAEVIAREMESCCLGACLEKIEIIHPAVVGKASDRSPVMYGRAVVQKIWRHGKQIFVSLDKDGEAFYLGIRLGMTGQLFRCDSEAALTAHTHAIFSFKDRPFKVQYRDPRRFGKIYLISSIFPIQKGIDPFNLTEAAFLKMMVRGRGKIKGVLMNQNLLAGIGNIYANEILFDARLHPYQRANRLSASRRKDLLNSIQKVLRRGIQKGGTTIRDFRSFYGMPGKFQEDLKVYGKRGDGCPRFGCRGSIRLIRSAAQAQPSFFCPECQRRV